MLCFRVGCFEEANFRCSDCKKAVYCSEKCGEHAWVKEKHFKACGDPFMSDNDKLLREDSRFKNIATMDFLLRKRSERVADFSRKHATELRKVEDHSIDREACEQWIKHLVFAAKHYEDWAKSSENPLLSVDNMSFVSLEDRPYYLKQLQAVVKDQVKIMLSMNTRTFARYFVDHLQYVAFDEFLYASKDVLRRAIDYGNGRGENFADWAEIAKFRIQELRMRLGARGLNTKGLKGELVDRLVRAVQVREKKRIVWLNYYAINRSMSFMMMLLYPEFGDQIDALCMSFAEVVQYVRQTGEKVLCLLVDDASYTGQQLAIKLRSFFSTNIFSDKQKQMIEFAVVVPYLASQAARELKKTTTQMQIQIFTTRASVLPNEHILAGISPKMRTMEEMVYEEGHKFLVEEEVPEFQKATSATGTRIATTMFPGDLLPTAAHSGMDLDGTRPFLLKFGPTSRPIVYFQHKLADRISVPNFLMAQAPYPVLKKNAGVEIKNICLFKNCEGAKFQYKNDPYEPMANDFIQTEENMCPFPPYKNIDYGDFDPAKTSLLDVE